MSLPLPPGVVLKKERKKGRRGGAGRTIHSDAGPALFSPRVAAVLLFLCDTTARLWLSAATFSSLLLPVPKSSVPFKCPPLLTIIPEDSNRCTPTCILYTAIHGESPQQANNKNLYSGEEESYYSMLVSSGLIARLIRTRYYAICEPQEGRKRGGLRRFFPFRWCNLSRIIHSVIVIRWLLGWMASTSAAAAVPYRLYELLLYVYRLIGRSRGRVTSVAQCPPTAQTGDRVTRCGERRGMRRLTDANRQCASRSSFIWQHHETEYKEEFGRLCCAYYLPS